VHCVFAGDGGIAVDVGARIGLRHRASRACRSKGSSLLHRQVLVVDSEERACRCWCVVEAAVW